MVSFRRYEQKLTDVKAANDKLGDDGHWIATRILCFPSHVDASFLKEATSLSRAETRMDETPAFHQTVEHHCTYLATSSGVKLSTEGDYLLQDDIDSFDYIIQDANWMWSEGFTTYLLSTPPRPGFEKYLS